jgi:prephenate dehydrogenase
MVAAAQETVMVLQVGRRYQTAGSRQAKADSKQQTTDNKQQATGNNQRIACSVPIKATPNAVKASRCVSG